VSAVKFRPDGPVHANILRSRDTGGIAGISVGMLHIDSPFVLVPGNAQNATTFPFPVLYECVRGVTLRDVVRATPRMKLGIVRAAQKLEKRGVRAIVGACGSFAAFQSALSASVAIPVCASVLVQIPFILRCMSHKQRLMIVFANRASLTDHMRKECGLSDMKRVVITDCMQLPAFKAMLDQPHTLENEALQSELCEHVTRVAATVPNVGAIMLQCSELPPYAAAIQRTVAVPILDIVTLTLWMHACCAREPLRGFL
jgi:Asp/Glu/hydantoin racemase